jgi:hypothetical protein
MTASKIKMIARKAVGIAVTFENGDSVLLGEDTIKLLKSLQKQDYQSYMAKLRELSSLGTVEADSIRKLMRGDLRDLPNQLCDI